MSISCCRLDSDLPINNLQNGDIKGAASEVKDATPLHSIWSTLKVCYEVKRSSCWLANYSFAIQSGYLCWNHRRLFLAVIKVGRNCDDAINVSRFASFHSTFLDFLKNFSLDFFRVNKFVLPLNVFQLNHHSSLFAFNDSKWPPVLTFDYALIIKFSTNHSFGVNHCVL